MTNENTNQRSAFSSTLYKIAERGLTLGASFILGIILARILSPTDYGQLSLLLIIINLLQIIIQSGLSTALVQAKNVDDSDCWGVMGISLTIALACYLLIWFCSPQIVAYYELDGMTAQFRCLALVLFPATINSIQCAILTRRFEFQKMMWVSFIATVISGVTGIFLAYRGYGLWALIIQQLISSFFQTLLLGFLVRLKRSNAFSFARIKALFSFGWKVLVVSLIETAFGEIQSLIIGKKFSLADLAFYNKGKQFPTLVGNNIVMTSQAILLPYMSKTQDDLAQTKELLRMSTRICAFCMFPLMAGMAIVARPLILVLLTDKWIACVPYVRIMCIFYAISPLISLSTQMYNAIGKPEIVLKVAIGKFVLRLVILVISVFCFDSVMAIAVGQAIWLYITLLINQLVTKALCNYTLKECMKDLWPALLYTAIMCMTTIPVSWIGTSEFVILIAQALVGVLTYFCISYLCKDWTLRYLIQKIKDVTGRKDTLNG